MNSEQKGCLIVTCSVCIIYLLLTVVAAYTKKEDKVDITGNGRKSGLVQVYLP
jgi:hypothetical protein